MNSKKRITHLAGLVLLVAGCKGEPAKEAPTAAKEAPAKGAATQPATAGTQPAAGAAGEAMAKAVTARLQPKSGSKVTGEAKLTPTENGVTVMLHVEGATPGKHGAHIHEKGDCSADDATSAGGHFNPAGHDHALPPEGERHLGDLGNIEVGEDGQGMLEITRKGANLKEGDPKSFLGKAVIIHEKEDDGSQPTGNAGGRVACAEIK